MDNAILNFYSKIPNLNVSRETCNEFESLISMIQEKNREINVISRKMHEKDSIRERHPKTPIVLVDLFTSPLTVLDNNMKKGTEEMNNALKTEYNKMIDNGYDNIIYLESNSALGNDFEGTVDAVHFTDIGFIRYSTFLIEKFKEFNLLKD